MKVSTKIDFCCQTMKGNFGIYTNNREAPFNLDFGKVKLITIVDGGQRGTNEVKYCPWCGKEIEYEINKSS